MSSYWHKLAPVVLKSIWWERQHPSFSNSQVYMWLLKKYAARKKGWLPITLRRKCFVQVLTVNLISASDAVLCTPSPCPTSKGDKDLMSEKTSELIPCQPIEWQCLKKILTQGQGEIWQLNWAVFTGDSITFLLLYKVKEAKANESPEEDPNEGFANAHVEIRMCLCKRICGWR